MEEVRFVLPGVGMRGINIATVLPSGKMSRTRTIQVEKQNYAPSVEVKDVKPGLEMKRIKGARKV